MLVEQIVGEFHHLCGQKIPQTKTQTKTAGASSSARALANSGISKENGLVRRRKAAAEYIQARRSPLCCGHNSPTGFRPPLNLVPGPEYLDLICSPG